MLRPSIILLLLGVMTLATGCEKSPGEKLRDRLRPVLRAAVRSFPADPSKLGRCDPALLDVAVMRLDLVGKLVGGLPKAPPDLAFAETANLYHLRGLLNEEPPSKRAVRWFSSVKRFGLLRPSQAKLAKMSGCLPGSGGISNCTLTPGLVKGHIVVFDLAGKASCAVQLEVAGPYSAVTRRGAMENQMATYVLKIARGLFHYSDKPAKKKPATWRFLKSLKGKQRYRITIDGKVVVRPG